MPITKLKSGTLPEGFSENAFGLFEVTLAALDEVVVTGEELGLPTSEIISAFMSATITQLTRVTGCEVKAARLLGGAADAMRSAVGEPEVPEGTHDAPATVQ